MCIHHGDGLAALFRMVPTAIGGIPGLSLREGACATPSRGTVADQIHRRPTARVTGRRRREHRRVWTFRCPIGPCIANRGRLIVYDHNGLSALYRMVPAAIGGIPGPCLTVGTL